jgi:hypothetical protein
VSLFGPKEPCPHCGHKVRQPDDPAVFLCGHCGQPGPWASPDQIKAWTEHQEEQHRVEQAQASARQQYQELLRGLVVAGARPAGGLASIAVATGYTAQELAQLHVQVIREVATAAVADDLLSPEENSHLGGLMSSLGVTWDQIRLVDSHLPDHVLISSVNGGILPQVASPHILVKKGEMVHIECAASLMKEVAIRQYQGGYSGFSIPLGKTGIRYKVGGSRGHSVEVGTQLNVADSGVLSVTNKRVVYSGTRKTVDMPYSKLVNLGVYNDGLQFHLSNRVNAPLFQVPRGSQVVAAIVNAAAQRAE